MDLARVLLVQIRSLAFILGSPVSFWFFLIVFLLTILYAFLLLILHCFSLFSLSFSLSFLFMRGRGRRHLEGGTCDRVTCPTTT